MKTNPLLAQLSLVVLMSGLVACSPPPGKEDSPPKPKVIAETAAAGGTMGALPKLGLAPAWELKDPEGKAVTSEQFKGKVVVVDFWATWCVPCRAEIPGYIELQKKYANDGVVIVGVSIDQAGPEVVKAFAEKFGINYPLVMADEGIGTAFGGIAAVPTTFLIDRAGEIRDRKEGAEETADYEKKIVAVISERT